MNTDFSQNLWYQGKELAKEGTTMLGWITSAKSEGGGGYYQVRCPAIHGYCDINEENCEEDVVAKEALPWIASIGTEYANSAVRNNNVRQYGKGQFVIVRFDGPNYSSPVIISAHKTKHPVLGKAEDFDQTKPYIIAPLVEKLKDNESAVQGDNGCFNVVTKASRITENGENIKGADKCGDSGSLSSDIGAFIGDFLKIVQNADGKIGSKFVDGVTGELFSMTGYIKKYLASITGVIRSGLGWVKAIITKYVRKAIDQLVKLIMTPIKGVTSTINETIEKILNMVFCSFGNIEALIANMIEDLLNTLVDSAINSVFGCLDTLVDGILNEIMGSVLGLIGDITGVIESVAGIIGGFGDLLGQAINAVLDFLGISCGGSGDCATSASNTLISAFNNPGEFGLTTGIKKSLEGGISGIGNLTSSIDQSTAEANAKAAEFAKGVDLGTANVPGVSTSNQALKKAFITANNVAASKVSNVFDFCNNLSDGKNPNGSASTPSNPGDNGPYNPGTTYVVVIGDEEDRYDAEYSIFPIKEGVKSGKTQKVKIRRNVDDVDGVIIFAVHLKSDDTARVVGITKGLASGGDLEKGPTVGDKKYATMPKKSKSKQEFPKKKKVISSQQIKFPKGEKEVIVEIPTVVAEPPKNKKGKQNAEEVTYTVSIYRSSADLNKEKYPYKNLPATSNLLNSAKLKIKFGAIKKDSPDESDIYLPPEIITSKVKYTIGNVSAVAGQPARFQVLRSPVVDFKTRVKCVTSPDLGATFPATDGTHYSGGQGILNFGPGESKKIFSVPTIDINSLSNTTRTFNVKFTDEFLPSKISSNLGGKGTNSGTRTGDGIVKRAVINYDSTFKPSPICKAEILLTSTPTPCMVQEENIPLNIGFIAKTSVGGYVLSYAWERTYDPTGTWTAVTDGARSETITEKVTTFGPSDVTINGTTLDAWETTDVDQSASITYSGATTNKLTVEQPSYLIMDEEYYRCIVTATPITESPYTPALTLTTNHTYVGITKTGVYSSTVNCAPAGTLKDGSLITYTTAASLAGTGESMELYEDYKPRMISENVVGDDLKAKFLADGSGIEVSGEKKQGNQASIKLRFEWDDNPNTSGQAVGELTIAGKTFRQGNKEKGSIEKTIYVDAGKTYNFQYKGASSDQGYLVISNGQVITWDDDISSKGSREKSFFDENARLSILNVSGKESSIVKKQINDFVAGFSPKAIGEYAQHTYGDPLNWVNIDSFYEGDFELVGGSGTGMKVKARFEAFPGVNGNPNNTRYKILAIIDPGTGYAVGDKLSFPDQGGYGFSGMGDLIKLLTLDFGISSFAGVCDVTEPTQDVPEDVPEDEENDPNATDCVIVNQMLEADPKSLTKVEGKDGFWEDKDKNQYYCPYDDDDDDDDDDEGEVVDPPIEPEVDPDDDTDPPPSRPAVVGRGGNVVAVDVPPETKKKKYKKPPLTPITGIGTGAIAKAELDEDGFLIDIVVTSTGIGYMPSDFDQCGILTNIVITNVGGYYDFSPTVYVNNDPTIAVAAIENGRLAEIRITNPQNIVYNSIPDIRITGAGGYGGSAKAVITYVPCPEVPNRYLNVVNKYNESKLGIVSVVDCP